MNANVIVAAMWDGPRTVGVVDPAASPTQGELDAIADRMTPANCGIKPTVRVLEALELPAYEDSREPVCDDVGRWRAPPAVR